MNRTELKMYLKETLYNSDGLVLTGKVKSVPKDLIDLLFSETSRCLSQKITERLFWLENDLISYPKVCQNNSCSNHITRNFRNRKYHSNFCSQSCNTRYQRTLRPNPFAGEEGKRRRKEGMMKKYGVDHNMKTQASLDNRVNTYQIKYGSNCPAGSFDISKRIRATNEATGHWLPIDQVDHFINYRREVDKITSKQDLASLKNFDKRGKLTKSYSLDHKFSVHEGFKQNIPPEIIGSIYNLEFIPRRENSSKKTKCSISLEKLLKDSEK